MTKIIIATPEEFQELIEAAVIKAMSSVYHKQPEQVNWMDVKDSAGYLNLAVQTLYQKVSQRDIPFHKRGKKLWFLKSDLDEWLKEGRQKTRQEIAKDVKDRRM